MQECRLFSAPAAGGTAPPIRKRTSGRTKRSVRNGLRTGTDRIANRPAVLSLPRFVSTPVVAPGFHIATHLGPFLVLGIGQHGLDLLVHFLPLLGARLTSVVPGQEGLPARLESSAMLPSDVAVPAELPADALEKSGANLCYLTPSHHFPTGVTMPATRRAQLLAWAAARPGRYILEDDYDSEFRFDTRPLPSLQGMAGPDGPVVYLTTFSKSLAPGIRIACMVLPQSLLARYRRDFATYANTVSRFEQQTLCEFMAGGYFTRHLARMRLAYKRRMEAFAAALRAALPGVELDGVHSGLHFLLTLPGAGGERAMVAAAARQGVRLRGLSEYYLARPELCRADTVVAGYSALKEDDVEKVAQALARAWLS